MTAVATLRNQQTASGWLVPRNAVHYAPSSPAMGAGDEGNTVDGEAQVAIVRNGETMTVPVTTGAIQGEWVVVESPELQAGDEAVGSVTSLVLEDSEIQFGPPGGGQRAPAGGQGGGGGARFRGP
jgi:hypothetical protein